MSPRYYTCIPPCKAKRQRAGSLNRHQATCKHWIAHEEKMLELRREAAMARRPTKRVKLAHNVVIVSSVIFSGNSSDILIGNTRTTWGANPNGH